jgi:hypothetical protein
MRHATTSRYIIGTLLPEVMLMAQRKSTAVIQFNKSCRLLRTTYGALVEEVARSQQSRGSDHQGIKLDANKRISDICAEEGPRWNPWRTTSGIFINGILRKPNTSMIARVNYALPSYQQKAQDARRFLATSRILRTSEFVTSATPFSTPNRPIKNSIFIPNWNKKIHQKCAQKL